jgi:hypothetical protein
MIHRLAPRTTPFHAEVALGSTCHDEPDLAGPTMIQRKYGRCEKDGHS